MMKTFATTTKSVLILFLLSAFSTACGEEPETVINDKITGIKVLVHYDSGLQIDQLKIQGWVNSLETAFEEAILPESPKLLEGTEQTFVLLLPDTLAGTTIRIDVDGYLAGEGVAAGQQEVALELSKIVKVNIRLSPDNVCESDVDNDGICDQNDPCIDLDGDGFGANPGSLGCPQQGADLDDTNPSICADTDQDKCDDCSGGSFDPAADGEDGDGDGICNVGDTCTDADQDGFGTGTLNNSGCENRPNDLNDSDHTICIDTDEDSCDDCSEGTFNPAADGSDLDEDGICDLTDTCTDLDGDGIGISTLNRDDCVNQGVTDINDDDQTTCADTDQDGCDDCFSGTFDPANDGIDVDSDGICDLGDSCVDVDGDGLGNGTLENTGCDSNLVDSHDNNAHLCADTDGDECDDCSTGHFAPSNDGLDYDFDGICDFSDLCFDADGDGLGNGTADNAGCVLVAVDVNDQDPSRCSDIDSDTCDDCSSGVFDTANDGPDSDSDGLCDSADTCVDLDGDGVGNGIGNNLGCISSAVDIDDGNSTLCADTDSDGCDDCISGSFNPNGDGDDTDSDGICNVSDTCTDRDNDGFGSANFDRSGCLYSQADSNDWSSANCADTDHDGCDDCSSGQFNPATDGDDSDNDGICDTADECTDLDGDGFGNGSMGNIGCVNTLTDTDDSNASKCVDTDEDQCDDCAGGTFSPDNDGADWDGDGLCNTGDTCTDKDEDGFGAEGTNNSGCIHSQLDILDNNANRCADTDADGCDDCSQGIFNPNNDGADADFDGTCNLSDTCTDYDEDGLGIGSNTSGCLSPTLDSNDTIATICADIDEDGCDDCYSGEWNPNNDGQDTDGDGICDLGDTCADNDNDGVCVELDCNDSNPNCRTVCTDADNDGYCTDLDCNDTYSTCTTDCTTNSDAANETIATVDCIEIYCGADPTNGSSSCYMVDTVGELADAIENSNNGETNILVGNMEVTNNLPNIDGNGSVTITQEPGTSITVNSDRLFRVNGDNTRFEDLVIYVESANEVFDINGDNTELDGVTIISVQEGEPREAITISSANNTIRNTQILGFEERGIEIKGNNANNNQILDSIITGGTDAAHVEKAAILVENGSGNAIVGNVLVDNAVSAIMLRKAKNTMIAHNTIANNFNGVTFTSDGTWNGFEEWKSTNTCIRNNTITHNNAGLSQSYTYTTWDESADCTSSTAAGHAYGNNGFSNNQNCNPTCTGLTPSGEFWEYTADPQYRLTNRESSSIPAGYYCLGETTRLWDGARDLGYDRNGSQSGNYNGTKPDIGGRETGTAACPQ